MKRDCQPLSKGAIGLSRGWLPRVMSAVIATEMAIVSVFQRSEVNGQGITNNPLMLDSSILNTPAADLDDLSHRVHTCLLNVGIY